MEVFLYFGLGVIVGWYAAMHIPPKYRPALRRKIGLSPQLDKEIKTYRQRHIIPKKQIKMPMTLPPKVWEYDKRPYRQRVRGGSYE